MNNKILISILILSSLLFSQIIEEKKEIDKIEKMNFDKKIEERLVRDIKAYLNNEFFILSIDASLQKIEKYEVGQDTQPVNNSVPNQPFKAQSTNNIGMILDTQDGMGANVNLPGLPVSKEKLKSENKRNNNPAQTSNKNQNQGNVQNPQSQQTFQNENKKLLSSQIQIKQILVKLMIDKSVTQEQEQFLKNLLVEKADISVIRGDKLDIIRTDFPGAKILDKDIDTKTDLKTENNETQQLEQSNMDSVSSFIKQYWPYLLWGLLLLVILFLMFRKKEETLVENVTDDNQNEDLEKIESLIEKMNNKDEIIQQNSFEAIKEEIVNLAVSDKKNVNEKVRSMWESAQAIELDKTATLYNLMGDGLFCSLFDNILSKNDILAISIRNGKLNEELDPTQKLDLAQGVYKDLLQHKYNKNQTIEKNDLKIKPFSFLDSLNIEQILYLINNEDTVTKAIVLSQLTSSKAASLLKRFPDADKSTIAIEVSRFSDYPVDSFRDIAKRLAKKAQDVPSFNNIAMNGVDLLIDMLEHLDTANEKSLLSSVQNDNPELYYKIRKVYITFEDILNIPDLALKNLIKDVEKEVLALSLFDESDEFKEKILSMLLPRPRMMVESMMKDLKNPSSSSIESAKIIVSKKAREMLKIGMFTLEDKSI